MTVLYVCMCVCVYFRKKNISNNINSTLDPVAHGTVSFTCPKQPSFPE